MLEALLTDPSTRARFRDDPAVVCREAGLDDLASELTAPGREMQTLEVRESKSSLAGLMLAAAAEAVSVHALVHHVGPFLHGDAAETVKRALTLPRLEAVRGLKGALAPARPGWMPLPPVDGPDAAQAPAPAALAA